MTDENLMNLAIEEAYKAIQLRHGGPFGAVIARKDTNEIVAIAHNTVLKDYDPTAHGEINAIRKACEVIGSIDLSDCKLYTTGYPCPMCLSAIKWAGITEVYYGCTSEQIDKLGFRDKKMYENNTSDIITYMISQNECSKLFQDYSESSHEIY